MSMKNINLAKIALAVFVLLAFTGISSVYAEQQAKEPSCKQEAKAKGIKDKKEMQKFVAECKKARKAAKKEDAAK